MKQLSISRAARRGLKQLVCLALALLCGIVGTACAGEYPTAWDTSQLYADADAWRADYQRALQLIQGHSDYRGRLADADVLREYLDVFYMGELTQIETRLYLYAALGNSRDPADPTFTELMALFAQLEYEENRLSAFVEPELAALSLEERRQLFADPALADYAYAFDELLSGEREPLSEAELELLATLQPALGCADDVYTILANLELAAPEITMPDGQRRTLDGALYSQVLSGDYSREFKAECYDALAGAYGEHAHTFAALLDECMSQNWALARVYGYDSARAAALAVDDVDEGIYELVISAARAGAGEFQRYLSAHGSGLGLETQYAFELWTSLAPYAPEALDYGAAVDQVRAALSALGDGYVGIFDQIVSGGQIDVYPAANKPSGSFTLALGEEYLPFVMLNFTGSPDDACTLAHELGHAVCGRMSALAQPGLYEQSSVAVQETVALVNELLYCQSRIDAATSDAERLYYIEYALRAFSDAFFVQALYAEFEERAYATIEAGGALDAEALSADWSALHADYYGDSVAFGENSRYLWAALPHLYYGYYVYNYAVAASCAAVLCAGLRDGGSDALADYMELLSAGSSAAPAELLAAAGADPLDPATYDAALEYFAVLVDEYEALIASCVG